MRQLRQNNSGLLNLLQPIDYEHVIGQPGGSGGLPVNVSVKVDPSTMKNINTMLLQTGGIVAGSIILGVLVNRLL